MKKKLKNVKRFSLQRRMTEHVRNSTIKEEVGKRKRQ
jgi:hypothetical protein